MTQFLEIIHRPCCEQFGVGTSFSWSCERSMYVHHTLSAIYFHYIWEDAELQISAAHAKNNLDW